MDTGQWPLPGDLVADDEDQEFWDACREGRLLIQQCRLCEKYYWPAGACLEHGVTAMTWVPAAGTGTVHTWTVIHQNYPNSFEDGSATNVAVVRLTEGPFMHTKIVGCSTGELRVGIPVEVDFVTIRQGVRVPLFRPAS